jgi:hypothetical protein
MKIMPTRIEPRAAQVDLAFPAEKPARLRLEIPFGKVEIGPGAGESIVRGDVTYNVEECKPAYTVKGRTVVIRQKCHILVPIDVRNKWNLDLGTAEPYSLEIAVGGSESDIDLSGVPLNNLKIESGAGELTVDFADPNPTRIQNARISTGAGRSTLRGLLNANLEDLRIDAGVGQLVAHFTGGPVTTDGAVKINGGVGEIQLYLPDDAPIRVTTSTGLGATEVGDGLVHRAGGYETTAYADADAKIDVRVSTGVGAIKINLI